MATLEDKLLGEKLQYYCSSSEDEDDSNTKESTFLSNTKSDPMIEQWSGVSTNTGPKGVLRDWQRYKQMEVEQRKEQEEERNALAKKLTLTCRSHLEDEKAELESEKLMDEEFLQQYVQKRMKEMLAINNSQSGKKFGTLINLESGFELIDAVDKEEKNVTVVIHLYEKTVLGCEAMNGCLQCLAVERTNMKFCKLRASAAGVSDKFRGCGLPAILVYRGGEIVGNFVRLIDEFGEDFYASDVESFLIQHGIFQEEYPSVSSIK